MRKCVDCGKNLSENRATRCRSCATKHRHKIGVINNKGSNNKSYKDGRCLKAHYCIDCGKTVCLQAAIYGDGRCKSCARKGKNHPNWKGGVTSLQNKIRKSFQYRQWRSDIFTRDGFTCQECGNKSSGNLEAHHIISVSQILSQNGIKTLEEAIICEELWDINNGKTLCKECHKKTDTYLIRGRCRDNIKRDKKGKFL